MSLLAEESVLGPILWPYVRRLTEDHRNLGFPQRKIADFGDLSAESVIFSAYHRFRLATLREPRLDMYHRFHGFPW